MQLKIHQIVVLNATNFNRDATHPLAGYKQPYFFSVSSVEKDFCILVDGTGKAIVLRSEETNVVQDAHSYLEHVLYIEKQQRKAIHTLRNKKEILEDVLLKLGVGLRVQDRDAVPGSNNNSDSTNGYALAKIEPVT